MSPPSKPDITKLLVQWREGDEEALERLIPIVYVELGRMANHYMRNESGLRSLQPTALVHEVYLRLAAVRKANWRDRVHFFGAVANIMRRVLVDLARARNARKRGSGAIRVSLRDVDASIRADAKDYFGGLSVQETAEVMGQSPATVKRRWHVAKGWLHRRITKGIAAGNGPT